MSDRFSDAFLQRLKDKVPITDLIGQYVAWDKTKSDVGKDDLWANCPFHSEHSPSFHADGRKAKYHCFGCGADGDHFRFVQELNGVSFPEAVAEISQLAGEPLPNTDHAPRPAHGNRSAAPSTAAPFASEPEKETPQPEGKWTIVETDPYHDRDGNVLYEVCRIQWKLPDGSWELGRKGKPKKTFVHRRPSGRPDGSYVWGMGEGEFMRSGPGRDWKAFDADKFAEWPKGERALFLEATAPTIFHHPQLEIAIDARKTILLPEGERKAKVAEKLGFGGTTNSGGAKNWDDAWAEYFRGADVVIPVDNDEPGREAAETKAKSLRGKAARVRVLDFAAFDPSFKPGFDIVDWHAAGGTAEQLAQLIEQLPDWRPRRPVSQFGAVGLNDLHRKDLQHEFLIDDFLDRQGVVMVPGSSGSGKTFLILEMCGNIAMGWDFWGMKTLPGLVLYQAGEGKQGVAKRVDGWLIDRAVEDRSNIPFEVLTRRINLFVDDKDTDELIAEGRRWAEYYGLPIRMVVIDTFNKAITGANENAGQDMTKVLARLERISVELDCAVVVPIHKSAEGKMRGHTSLTGDVANVLNVTELEIRDQNQRIIRTAQLDKNKDGEKGPPHRFVLRQVVVGEKPDGKPITTCVVDRPNGDENGLVAEGKLSANQTIFLRTLRDAIDVEGVDAPMSVMGVPRGKQVIGTKAFFDRLWRKWPFTTPDNEPENRKKEFERAVGAAGKALALHGYVERDNDAKLIWWTGKSDRPERKPKPVATPGTGIEPAVKREISEMDAPF